MVDMGDDAKIADVALIHALLYSGRTAGRGNPDTTG